MCTHNLLALPWAGTSGGSETLGTQGKVQVPGAALEGEIRKRPEFQSQRAGENFEAPVI